MSDVKISDLAIIQALNANDVMPIVQDGVTQKVSGQEIADAILRLSTEVASKVYVDTAIHNLINGAPGMLDTLKALADAINDDPNFYNDMINIINTKLNISDFGDQFQNFFSMMTTDALMEGNTNLYYTDSRVMSAITGTSPSFNSVSLTGAVTNPTDAATKAYVDSEVNGLIASAPDMLNSLKKLADAINDDPNFYNDIMAILNNKLNDSNFQEYFDASFAGKNTYHLKEGSNLYFTPERAISAIQNTSHTFDRVTITWPVENPTDAATKAYVDSWNESIGTDPTFNSVTITGSVTKPTDAATKAYVDSQANATPIHSTDDLSEGTTNLYFTAERAVTAIFNSGIFSVDLDGGSANTVFSGFGTHIEGGSANTVFSGTGININGGNAHG